MKKQEHTPVPWEIGYDNDVGPDDEGFWEWLTAGPARLDYTSGKEEEAKANAEFIVRACNCHAELLEALSLCKMTLGALGGHTAAERDTAILAAKLALAKAKEAP